MKLMISVSCVAVLLACSLPLKQRATISLQASEAALESAHDIERGLCFINPRAESGTHCTNAIAATVGLTDARHQQAAVYFSKAFADEIIAANILLAYRAGDPPPNSVATYQKDISDLLTLARELIPNTKAQDFLTKAQLAVDEATKVAIIVGVKP